MQNHNKNSTGKTKDLYIAKQLLNVAKSLVSGNQEPDLYVLYEDGKIEPIYLSDNIIAAKKKKRKNTNNLRLTKEIFLTPQAYEFYNGMDEKNKSDFRKYCKELKEKGTLEGNPHGEKIEGTSNLFCIRLTLGESNDRYFYCYVKNNCIIVFDAYTKAKQSIPKNVLDKAKKDVKKLSNLESMEGLKPFDEIEKDSDCNSKEDKSKDKK